MTMQLYVWGSALDVPSVDPGCTTILAYLQLVDVPFNVVVCNDPNVSPTGTRLKDHLYPALYCSVSGDANLFVTASNFLLLTVGELPLLKDGPAWIGGSRRILTHLVNKGLDGNAELTPEEKAQYFA